MLAGVSVDYYVRMERGGLGGASESVLDALASALKLDEAEREHLYDLARQASVGSSRSSRKAAYTVRPVIQQVPTPSPTPRRGYATAGTTSRDEPLARALYAPVFDSDPAVRPTRPVCHLDPERARDLFVDYDDIAEMPPPCSVWRRVAIRTTGPSSSWSGTVHRSELFRQRWASRDVRFHRSGRKRLRHPAVGQLDLDFEAMELPSEPGLQLNVYTAAVGTPPPTLAPRFVAGQPGLDLLRCRALAKRPGRPGRTLPAGRPVTFPRPCPQLVRPRQPDNTGAFRRDGPRRARGVPG